MIPAYARAFEDALVSARSTNFTIHGLSSPILVSPGVQNPTWLRLRDRFDFPGRQYEYTFKTSSAADVEIVAFLARNASNHWRLFAYNTKGMLFSLNLTRAWAESRQLLPLRPKLKSFTRGLTKEDRSESMDGLVTHLQSAGVRCSADRIVDLGDFDVVRGIFARTTARKFMQEFMTTALIKGHFMGNKNIRLPGLVSAPVPNLDPVEAAMEEKTEEIDDENGFDPTNQADARDRTLASIARRRGQHAFRSALLAAYGRSCAISGCNFEGALEAAHIQAYRGEQTNYVQNGLLLRADLHTLFDLKRIAVDSKTMTVRISPVLQGTTYGDLDGQKISLPRDARLRPNKQALDNHRREAGL